MLTKPITLRLLPNDVFQFFCYTLVQDNVLQAKFWVSEVNETFELASRLGKGNRNACPARVLCSRLIDSRPQIFRSASVAAARFRRGNLKSNRVKLLVIASGAALQHRQYMFRIRHGYE